MKDCKLCGSKRDTDFHRFDCLKGMSKDEYIADLEYKMRYLESERRSLEIGSLSPFDYERLVAWMKDPKLSRIAAACGMPDAAEACRTILKIIKE